MNSRLIIIGRILPKHPAQVRLPEHDHVVETFPSPLLALEIPLRWRPAAQGSLAE
jgi:hypothetical protein